MDGNFTEVIAFVLSKTLGAISTTPSGISISPPELSLNLFHSVSTPYSSITKLEFALTITVTVAVLPDADALTVVCPTLMPFTRPSSLTVAMLSSWLFHTIGSFITSSFTVVLN